MRPFPCLAAIGGRFAIARVSGSLLLATALACATGEDSEDDGAQVVSATAPSSASLSSSSPAETTTASSTGPDDATADGSSGAESTTTSPPPDLPPECTPGAPDCPCADGACTDPALCIDDVCVGPIACADDPNEPNDFDDDDVPLGEITDDDAQTLTFSGVLDTPDDVDWFSYRGVDVLGETVDPARSVQVTGGTLEICKFFACDAGQALVSCPVGTMPANVGLLEGCCAAGDFAFASDGIECLAGAFETGGTVRIRLAAASSFCVEYTGTVHF